MFSKRNASLSTFSHMYNEISKQHTLICLMTKCYQLGNKSAGPSSTSSYFTLETGVYIEYTLYKSLSHEQVDCIQFQMAFPKRGVYIILCEAFCTWPATRELHYIAVPLYPANLTPECLCSCTANSSNNQWFVDFQQRFECNGACCQSIFVFCRVLCVRYYLDLNTQARQKTISIQGELPIFSFNN